MQALGLYRQAFGPAHIDCLPVITPDYPRPLGNRLGQIPRSREEYFKHFDEFRSVFDAAALGQYLGGCDTAGRPAGEHGAGFINETAVFDPSAYGYCTALDGQGRRLYYLRTPAGLCRINNLHIHSKNLHPFTSGPAR
jgi:hypothetical protein